MQHAIDKLQLDNTKPVEVEITTQVEMVESFDLQSMGKQIFAAEATP